MPAFSIAQVVELLSERPGLQRVRVNFDAAEQLGDRAYCLTELTGPVAVGDRVVVNTTAVDLGLGTGGWHVVHWNLAAQRTVRSPRDHVVKLRYTSLQHEAGTDELAHPEADEPLAGLPVAACTLHSQVALVAAGFRHAAPGCRLVYVMTDGGALPLALSDLLHDLRTKGLLSGTVSAGHAFGGDLEAVTVASGLGLAAHVLQADAVVVGMGPGVVGTGTALGTSAIEAAGALDCAAALGGDPVLVIRASEIDERSRHRGISHHVRTVCRLLHVDVSAAPVPLEVAELRHVTCVPTDVPDPAEVLDTLNLTVTSMGRGPADDPLFFRSGVAGGVLLGRKALANRR